MQMIEVKKLNPHPRNKEFFDDMYGDKWEDFKKSIARRGVVEPIVATKYNGELITVSGHQRERACLEIGILEVPYVENIYPDFDKKTGTSKEDMILEDLISTNLMQRGVGNVNAIKMCKCINELERIYGIKKGNNQYKGSEIISEAIKTQSDLAKQIGIDERQLRNYKALNNLIPELQSLVEHDSLKATTAYKIWAKMPQEEQEKFFNEIGREEIKKLTQKQTEQYINKAKELEETNKVLQTSFNELSDKYTKEKNKEPKTIEKIVEVDNTDYALINKLKKDLEFKNKEYEIAKEKEQMLKDKITLFEKGTKDYKDLKKQIEDLTVEKNNIGRQIESGISLVSMVNEIKDFLKTKLAPIQFSEALLEQRKNTVVINNIKDIVECVENWCRDIRKYLPENQQNIIDVEEYK